MGITVQDTSSTSKRVYVFAGYFQLNALNKWVFVDSASSIGLDSDYLRAIAKELDTVNSKGVPHGN